MRYIQEMPDASFQGPVPEKSQSDSLSNDKTICAKLARWTLAFRGLHAGWLQDLGHPCN